MKENITIGRYKVEEELGRGGMGVVYRAIDPALERNVAIKVLPAKRLSKERMIERFLKEAKLAARLNHTNIIKVYDIGKDEDTYHIVMEYVEGKTLRELIESEKESSVAKMINIFHEICDAIAYAHEQKIIHRDIKPDNIMITSDNKIKVMDFGLACLEDRHSLTEAGQVMGTISYFSPEQAKGETVDHRCDIYSLGIVFFEMLSGVLPFQASNPSEMIQKHLSCPVPSILKHNPEIPKNIDRIIRKMMMKNPDLRYDNLRQVIQELNENIVITQQQAPESLYIKEEQKDPNKLERIIKKLEEEKNKLAILDPGIKSYEDTVICPHCRKRNEIYRKYCSECGGILGTISKEVEIIFDEAMNSLSEEKFTEAEELLLKVVEMEPDFVQAYIELGRIKTEFKKFDEAKEMFVKVLKKYPNDVNIFFHLADINKKENKPEKAIAKYQNILKIEPKNEKAHLLLAFLYSQQKMFNEAIKHFWDVTLINPANLEAYLQLGIIYTNINENDKAISCFEKAASIDPKCEQAMIWLADLYLKKRNLTKSEEIYQRVLDMDPNNPQVYAKLGILYSIEKKDAQALRELKQATRLDPKNIEARNMIARIYTKINDIDKAKDELKEIIKYHPQNEQANYNLGELYLKENNLDAALEHFEKCVLIDNKNPDIHSKLGTLYSKKENTQQSYKEFKTAIELDPYKSEYREQLGVLYYSDEKRDLAIKEMEKAVLLDVNNIEYINALGMMYLENNQPDKASEQFRKAIKKNPKDYMSYAFLGRVYMHQNLVNQAIKEFNKALSINPDSYTVRTYIAKAYRKSGKTDLAIEEYKKAIELANDQYHAKESLSRSYSELGKEFLDKKDYEKAIDILEGAEKLNKSAEILYFLAKAYYNARHFEKAFEKAKEAYLIEPSNYEIMSLLAEILYNDKQYQKVSSILEKIIRIAPWKTDSKLFLCDVYQKLNQHKKAIKLADEMINGDSENSHEYQFKKAKSLYELGDYHKAVFILESAIEHKDDWRYHDLLASVFVKLKDKANALIHWNKAMKLNSDEEYSQQIKKNLKSLK